MQIVPRAVCSTWCNVYVASYCYAMLGTYARLHSDCMYTDSMLRGTWACGIIGWVEHPCSARLRTASTH